MRRATGPAIAATVACAVTMALPSVTGTPTAPTVARMAGGLRPATEALTVPPLAQSPVSPAASPALGTPWVSTNWSGYAQSGSGITAVSGSWTVPSVTAGSGAGYSATWIGIDGFTSADPSLIQTGTEQDAPGRYSAWWSTTYYEQPIAAPVAPGDAMSADIHQLGGTTWSISLRDASRGWSFTTTVAYGGPGQSAEWILEAPAFGGQPAPLASLSPTTFDLAAANGTNALLVALQAGLMLPAGAVLPTAVPSLPDTDTDGFTVATGAVAPLPPLSS